MREPSGEGWGASSHRRKGQVGDCRRKEMSVAGLGLAWKVHVVPGVLLQQSLDVPELCRSSDCLPST